jgi:2-polyprenyl-3-methyl-5-hydroxy-6-metoxy-1,4-benzoquinol methylase
MIESPWLHQSFFELQDYLGHDFNLMYCNPGDAKAEKERAEFTGTDDEWTRQTMIYAYQNIALATAGIHRHYIARLLDLTPDMYGVSVLDYGAGGGQVGIGLHYLGYKVSFADIYGQSLLWLTWRLRELRLDLPVYIIDDLAVTIPRHNIALCLDVLEHLPPEEHKGLLTKLKGCADVVFVNLIRENAAAMGGIHHDVDFDGLAEFVAEKWNGRWEDFYPDKDGKPRQRLLIYGNVT